MNFLKKIFPQENKSVNDKKSGFSLRKWSQEEINKNGIFKVHYIYVSFYLNEGGDAFVRDEKGNTLAHLYPELSKELVQAGLDFNLENNEGYTPVMCAAMSNQLTVEMINASSKETLNKIYPNGETVLTVFFSKAIHVDENILQALAEKEVDVNQRNREGKYPLDCLKYGIDDVLPELIKYGLDIQQLKIKNKPLLSYILIENPDLFLTLKDADLTQKDENGNTLLHLWATYLDHYRGDVYGKNINIFQNLLLKIDINAQNEDGETPLLSALKRGKYYRSYFCHGESHYSDSTREREASLLIERGADVEKMDCLGNTALHYAAKENLNEVIHLLVKAGADVYALNENGQRASDLASGLAKEYLKLVEISEEFNEYKKICAIKKRFSSAKSNDQRIKE